MDDLISRKAAVRITTDMHGLCRYDVLHESIQAIKELPAVDAVPVVRCRDCKFYHGVNEECGCNGGYHSEDWFCADGEWRDGE